MNVRTTDSFLAPTLVTTKLIKHYFICTKKILLWRRNDDYDSGIICFLKKCTIDFGWYDVLFVVMRLHIDYYLITCDFKHVLINSYTVRYMHVHNI